MASISAPGFLQILEDDLLVRQSSISGGTSWKPGTKDTFTTCTAQIIWLLCWTQTSAAIAGTKQYVQHRSVCLLGIFQVTNPFYGWGRSVGTINCKSICAVTHVFVGKNQGARHYNSSHSRSGKTILLHSQLQKCQMRPHTQHINCIYHHFRIGYANKWASWQWGTKDQLGDPFTKQADATSFEHHRMLMLGW